jgi:cytochrome c553
MDEHDVHGHGAYDRAMRRLLLVLLVSLFLVGARQRVVRHPAPAGTPTFHKEVVRIFQQHCQTCHREGDIAPFALTSYAEAKPYALLIKLMTQSRQMPPWKPADGCGDFADERRLSDAEIATIAKWVEAGAPEGRAADAPPPLQFASSWTRGEPDLILETGPYTPPAHGDTYRCFTMPANNVTLKHVVASDTHPGDRESVHHVLSFLDTTGASQQLDDAEPGPGYTCFGGPGFSTTGTLGGWAPGSRPLELPDGAGFEMPANTRVVLQVHYHPHHGAPKEDRTQFGIYFSKEVPQKLMRVLPILNDHFTIPPHTSNYVVNADFPLLTPIPLQVWFVAPHMHLLGRRMEVTATHLASNKTQCLITIDDWDFNWQGAYRFKQPVTIPAGSRLSVRAVYDNPNSQSVSWGEATTDEMCLAFLGVTLN